MIDFTPPSSGKPSSRVRRLRIALVTCASLLAIPPAGAQWLSSWSDGAAKRSLVTFVERTTQARSPDFVRPEARIAVFDNDGTLWTECPMYAQGLFVVDRTKELAPEHPAWRHQQPFEAILHGNLAAAASGGTGSVLRLVAATHAGMTTDAFDGIVERWIDTARNPRFHRPYTQLAYVPMLELLTYLRAKGFKTYIVSGGGAEFMRPWTERVYGIPPQQVIGSTIKLRYEVRNGKPALVRLPQIDMVDDGPGKPVAIQKFIGRRPILAFGNSDGDRQMLEWTASGHGLHFVALVHHTDTVRECAYDRRSRVGKLDVALEEARRRGWTVVDMRQDWRQVFRFEPERQRR